MQKTQFKKKSGMVGTVVAVVILSLLMSISMAFMKVVQTESQVVEAIDYTDRAMDAAFSGIEYAVSIMQSTRETFKSGFEKKRPYLVQDKTNIDTIWGTISDKTEANYDRLIDTDWIFVDEDMDFLDIDDGADKPYQFRAISYPANNGSNAIDPDRFYVKSQGLYLELATDGTVQNTFKFQMIAEISVDSVRKILKIVNWRRTDYENDANFFKYTEF
jgi:hypothetical protein